MNYTCISVVYCENYQLKNGRNIRKKSNHASSSRAWYLNYSQPPWPQIFECIIDLDFT